MEGCTFPAFQASNIRRKTGKTVHSRISGFTWKFGISISSGKMGTFENFGGTQQSQKNMTSRKNGTFEKFGGIRKFRIPCYPGKQDIRKFQGYRGVPEKHEICKRRDIRQIRGFTEILNFHVDPEKEDIRKFGGCKGIPDNHEIRYREDIRKIQGCRAI